MSFIGKIILITGASSGIGAGAAVWFARNGASLSLIGRNAENLKETINKCKSINPKAGYLPIQADVTSDATEIIAKTIDKFSQLDVLVNNAGVYKRCGIQNSTIDDYDYIFNTNVRAVYDLTKVAVPELIKSKGNIVNVSSISGLRSFPDALPYCMSKAAIDQFTRCLALELGPLGVRVNAVNPAVIMTDIFNRAGMDTEKINDMYENCKRTYPLRRPGTVEDTAEVIGFLADHKKARFITGVTLPVDSAKSLECPR